MVKSIRDPRQTVTKEQQQLQLANQAIFMQEMGIKQENVRIQGASVNQPRLVVNPSLGKVPDRMKNKRMSQVSLQR